MDSFGKRLRKAREHAGLNQSQLARLVPPMKPQAIQHLENPKNKARGSKSTIELARACGVDPDWLANGKGSMLPVSVAKEPGATYTTLSHDAQQIGIAWSKLSPERQDFFRELLFMQAAFENRAPWLRRGRPKSETYAEWERRQEQNFYAMAATLHPKKP